MTRFLRGSELSERSALVKTFVREVVVSAGKIVVSYNVPMPDDSRTPGADSEEVLLGGSVTPAARRVQ